MNFLQNGLGLHVCLVTQNLRCGCGESHNDTHHNQGHKITDERPGMIASFSTEEPVALNEGEQYGGKTEPR